MILPARALAHVLSLAVAVAVVAALPPTPARAHDTGIWFPVQTPVDFVDSWGDPRAGHRHEGVDIMAPQMAEVYAASSGTVSAVEGEECRQGQYCSSFYLLVDADDGHSHFYLHLNNDTPGRPNGCDGVGGVENAFSPRLVDELDRRGTLVGVRVERGEHIAYVGS